VMRSYRMPLLTGFAARLPGLLLIMALVSTPDALAGQVQRGENRQVPAASHEGLKVRNSSGLLDIRGEDREDVFIDVQFRVRGKTGEELDKIIERLSLVLEADGPWLRLSPRYEDQDLHRVQVRQLNKVEVSADIRVRVPWGFGLDASIASGDMLVQDLRGDVLMVATSGDVEARHLTGQFELELTSGDLKAEDLAGDVLITVTSGDLRLTGIQGDVQVRGISGELVARELGGSLLVQTESGAIRANDVHGDQRLASAYGQITVKEPRGDVQINTSNGAIVVTMPDALGQSFNLTSSSGDIQVYLSQLADLDVDLQTSSGLLHWRLPMQLTAKPTRKSLHGIMGKGGTSFHVVTASGDIRNNPVEE